MTKQMPPEPDLENHTDEQLDRLDRAISDALTEGLADIARGSSDLSAKDLVSVHDALKQARTGDWVDSGGLNQALELLVKTLAGKRSACGLRVITKAAYPDDDLLVADQAGAYLESGLHTCIVDAIEEARYQLKRAGIVK